MIIKDNKWYLLIAALLLFSFTLSEAGEVKVTTYYPAPYGEYKKIMTTGDAYLATDTSARVGIGTTLPLAALDISRNSDSNPHLRIAGNNATNKDIFLSDSTDGEAWKLSHRIHTEGNRLETSYRLGTNQWLTLMSMKPDGKVGIGTTNPTQQLEITGNFKLPSTTSVGAAGVIRYSASNTPLIHTYNAGFFAGPNAGGSFTNTGGGNVGIGLSALYHNAGGQCNTALGAYAAEENLGASFNTAIGNASLRNNTSGMNNTAVGASSLLNNTSGQYNSGLGTSTLLYNRKGSFNTAVGYQALYCSNASTPADTAPANNTAVGAYAGYSCTTGSNYNVFLGYEAGYYERGSNKLYIANDKGAVGTPSYLIYGDFTNKRVNIRDTLRLEPRASAPSSPSEGDLYVDSGTHHIYCYLSGAWKQLDN